MRIKKYVKLVNWNFLYVKTKIRKPIIAGETSKNQVKYSLGFIPERINPMKNKGIKIFEEEIGLLTSHKVPGELAFKLYDTYGFPLDLTMDLHVSSNKVKHEAG